MYQEQFDERKIALEPKDFALMAVKAAEDKKAEDIVVVDVAEMLVVTDYFVICTGSNERMVRSIADEIEDQLRDKADIKPIGREGRDEGKWILLDFADIVVHVFQPDEREFYRLERLWGDAPRLDIDTAPLSQEAPDQVEESSD